MSGWLVLSTRYSLSRACFSFWNSHCCWSATDSMRKRRRNVAAGKYDQRGKTPIERRKDRLVITIWHLLPAGQDSSTLSWMMRASWAGPTRVGASSEEKLMMMELRRRQWSYSPGRRRKKSMTRTKTKTKTMIMTKQIKRKRLTHLVDADEAQMEDVPSNHGVQNRPLSDKVPPEVTLKKLSKN